MAGTIRLLIVEDVAEVAQFLRSALAAQAQVALLDIVPDGADAIALLPEVAPDVVLVDALLRGSVRAPAVIAAAHEAGIPTVVVTVPQTKVSVDPSRGIAAVLTMPFLGFDLVGAVKEAHAATRAPGGSASARVVAVYGPKGGVGRTTVAYNLAAACVASGRRTVLLDAAFQFGDLRTLLRAGTAPSILDLPTDRIVEEDLERVLHRDASGVEALLAPDRIEQAEMVTVGDVEKTVALLRSVADVVVADLPVTLGESTLALLDTADLVLVLIDEGTTSIANARAAIETFRTLGYPEGKVRIVVNRIAGNAPAAGLAERLGAAPTHALADDAPLAARASAAGRPLVELEPEARLARDLRELADDLVADLRPRVGVNA